MGDSEGSINTNMPVYDAFEGLPTGTEAAWNSDEEEGYNKYKNSIPERSFLPSLQRFL